MERRCCGQICIEEALHCLRRMTRPGAIIVPEKDEAVCCASTFLDEARQTIF